MILNYTSAKVGFIPSHPRENMQKKLKNQEKKLTVQPSIN